MKCSQCLSCNVNKHYKSRSPAGVLSPLKRFISLEIEKCHITTTKYIVYFDCKYL